MNNRHTNSVLTSVVTAFVANESIHFVEKIASVILLAVFTEVARQAVAAVFSWVQKRKKS